MRINLIKNLSLFKRFYSLENKKIIKNGPNLKEFLSSANKQVDKEIENEELITNRLVVSAIGDDFSLNKQDDNRPRKVFFEIHGCQMNTNDSEIALSILKETGKYEKCNTEKEADVILLSKI